MHLKSVSRMGQCHVWDKDFCIHYGQEVDYSGFKGYALKVSCIKALLIIITKRKKILFHRDENKVFVASRMGQKLPTKWNKKIFEATKKIQVNDLKKLLYIWYPYISDYLKIPT